MGMLPMANRSHMHEQESDEIRPRHALGMLAEESAFSPAGSGNPGLPGGEPIDFFQHTSLASSGRPRSNRFPRELSLTRNTRYRSTKACTASSCSTIFRRNPASKSRGSTLRRPPSSSRARHASILLPPSGPAAHRNPPARAAQ